MRTRVRCAIWLGYWTVLAASTHVPPQALPGLQTRGLDKIAHWAAFAVLGLLSAWASRARSTWRRLGLAALIAAYAAVDEYTQPWTGRSAEVGDWLADAGGLSTGLVAHWLLQRKQINKKLNESP